MYIGRAGYGEDGYFGNPHPVGRCCQICGVVHDRAGSIAAFKKYFLARIHSDPEYYKRVLELKDKRLVCFCKPQACHGDVIVAFLQCLESVAGKEWLHEHTAKSND